MPIFFSLISYSYQNKCGKKGDSYFIEQFLKVCFCKIYYNFFKIKIYLIFFNLCTYLKSNQHIILSKKTYWQKLLLFESIQSFWTLLAIRLKILNSNFEVLLLRYIIIYVPLSNSLSFWEIWFMIWYQSFYD